MGRGLRELLRGEEGHATGEAVIMIPFFILVWGCIIFVSQGYERAIDVGAETRRDAWAHAMDDCRGPVGSGTEVSDATNPPLGPFGDLFDMIVEIISFLPLVGDVWPGFINEERQYVRRDAVEKPTVVGGGNQKVGHTLVLMCNEETSDTSLEELAEHAWGVFGL